MKKLIVAIVGFILPMVVVAQVDQERVKVAVQRIMNDYPQSTLQDVYKSFFQDKFGPEHIINDTIAAKRYLSSELSREDIDSVIILELTGVDGNFIRVGLGAIKSGKVDFDVFLNAFIKSAFVAKHISVEQWRKEWIDVLSAIEAMDVDIANYEVDKEAINKVLQQGRYVMHHSQQYRDTYNPHYRIIAKEIFEQEILPLLK